MIHAAAKMNVFPVRPRWEHAAQEDASVLDYWPIAGRRAIPGYADRGYAAMTFDTAGRLSRVVSIAGALSGPDM